jgi:hypothetical protein
MQISKDTLPAKAHNFQTSETRKLKLYQSIKYCVYTVIVTLLYDSIYLLTVANYRPTRTELIDQSYFLTKREHNTMTT